MLAPHQPQSITSHLPLSRESQIHPFAERLKQYLDSWESGSSVNDAELDAELDAKLDILGSDVTALWCIARCEADTGAVGMCKQLLVAILRFRLVLMWGPGTLCVTPDINFTVVSKLAESVITSTQKNGLINVVLPQRQVICMSLGSRPTIPAAAQTMQAPTPASAVTFRPPTEPVRIHVRFFGCFRGLSDNFWPSSRDPVSSFYGCTRTSGNSRGRTAAVHLRRRRSNSISRSIRYVLCCTDTR